MGQITRSRALSQKRQARVLYRQANRGQRCARSVLSDETALFHAPSSKRPSPFGLASHPTTPPDDDDFCMVFILIFVQWQVSLTDGKCAVKKQSEKLICAGKRQTGISIWCSGASPLASVEMRGTGRVITPRGLPTKARLRLPARVGVNRTALLPA